MRSSSYLCCWDFRNTGNWSSRVAPAETAPVEIASGWFHAGGTSVAASLGTGAEKFLAPAAVLIIGAWRDKRR